MPIANRLTCAAAALALPFTAAAPALADDHGGSSGPGFLATVETAEGAIAGTVSIRPTASGMMLIGIDLRDMPPGLHGVHIHETGDCSGPEFKTAGGHVAGDANHGVMVEGGPHPGDLPNVHVGEEGRLAATFFNDRLTRDHLTDADGAAFIVHAGPDDYES